MWFVCFGSKSDIALVSQPVGFDLAIRATVFRPFAGLKTAFHKRQLSGCYKLVCDDRNWGASRPSALPRSNVDTGHSICQPGTSAVV